jgi:DNA-binding NarL/FixJ family response regulator
MPERGVVVVEDDPMTRGLIANTLKAAGFTVETAANAVEARRIIAQTDPDAVVLDIDLGMGPTGIDLADALLRDHPHLTLLFLTHLPDSRFAGRQTGSIPKKAGYMRKERLVQPEVLVETLEALLRGDSDCDTRDDLDPDRPFAKLSRTQIEVIRMVALGLSNQQIADKRGTSVRAVQDLISRCLENLGIDDQSPGSTRVAAARQYIAAAGIPGNRR